MKKKGSYFLGWIICSIAALFYCYEYILRIEPSVMAPQLMHFYHVSAAGLGILTAMYYYAYTPLQLIVGVLTDRFGSRKILLFALLMCVIGCCFIYYSHSVQLASIGRFLIGAGSAFAFVGVLRLAAIWLPARHFALFVGLATGLGMVGAMFGDIGLSWALRHVSWHGILAMSGLVGLILLPLFFIFVHEKSVDHTAVEPLAEIAMWPAIKTAMTNKHILKSGIIGCVMYLSLSVFADMWGVSYLQAMNGFSLDVASKVNAMVYLGWLVGAPTSGYLSSLFQSRRWILVFGNLCAFICSLLLLNATLFSQQELMYLCFFFGFSCSVEVLVFAVAKDVMPKELVGTAIGIVNFLVMLGGMLILPLVGFLLDYFWQGDMQLGVRHYTYFAFHNALLTIPVCLLLGALLSFTLDRTYRAK